MLNYVAYLIEFVGHHLLPQVLCLFSSFTLFSKSMGFIVFLHCINLVINHEFPQSFLKENFRLLVLTLFCAVNQLFALLTQIILGFWNFLIGGCVGIKWSQKLDLWEYRILLQDLTIILNGIFSEFLELAMEGFPLKRHLSLDFWVVYLPLYYGV